MTNPKMSPLLIVNPANDWELATLARDLMADGERTSVALELELRRTFPRLVVHRRDLSGEATPTWYIYREGRWLPQRRRSDHDRPEPRLTRGLDGGPPTTAGPVSSEGGPRSGPERRARELPADPGLVTLSKDKPILLRESRTPDGG